MGRPGSLSGGTHNWLCGLFRQKTASTHSTELVPSFVPLYRQCPSCLLPSSVSYFKGGSPVSKVCPEGNLKMSSDDQMSSLRLQSQTAKKPKICGRHTQRKLTSTTKVSLLPRETTQTASWCLYVMVFCSLRPSK